MYRRRRTACRMRGCSLRIIGLALMIIGGLLIILFVPFEVWFALLGAALTVIGFFLWHCFS